MGRKLDLIGKQFDRLTVVAEHPERSPIGQVRWLCKCSCGGEKIILGFQLTSGKTRSCGCLERENRVANCTAKKFDELFIGRKFGRLTVQELAGVRNRKTIVRCACECGRSWEGVASNLVNGSVKSCGCLLVETTRARATTHGATSNRTATREYRAYRAMLRRCYDENHKDYPYYGGRGIGVCPRWKASFESFLEDIGEAPSESHTLGRIRNDGMYENGNCRWETRKEQANNSRQCTMLTMDEQTMSLKSWCERYSADYYRVRSRLNLGWDLRKALTTPHMRIRGHQ